MTTMTTAQRFSVLYFQMEAAVQWLNEAVILFTLALQQCQQLVDKVAETVNTTTLTTKTTTVTTATV